MNLDDIAARYRRAADRCKQLRAELHQAIRAAQADGISQAEIVRVTGYSRERLRQIAMQGTFFGTPAEFGRAVGAALETASRQGVKFNIANAGKEVASGE